jgi:hypothetical protein
MMHKLLNWGFPGHFIFRTLTLQAHSMPAYLSGHFPVPAAGLSLTVRKE